VYSEATQLQLRVGSACAPQGRFREPVTFDDMLTGQEFQRPLRLPSAWLVRALCHMARRLSPSLVISECSLLAPLAATAQARCPPYLPPQHQRPCLAASVSSKRASPRAQAIHVAPAGQAAPALTDPPQEDMRACGALLAAHGARPPRLLCSATRRRTDRRASCQHVQLLTWQLSCRQAPAGGPAAAAVCRAARGDRRPGRGAGRDLHDPPVAAPAEPGGAAAGDAPGARAPGAAPGRAAAAGARARRARAALRGRAVCDARCLAIA